MIRAASVLPLVVGLSLGVRPAVAAQQSTQRPAYERDVPPALAALARVGEDSARTVALAQVPGGVVEAVELVRARGKLIWTFDIKRRGGGEPTEVNVNAMDGSIVPSAPGDVTPLLKVGTLSGPIRLD